MRVVRLRLGNGVSVEVKVFVVSAKPLGFPFVLGMNGVMALGGVSVTAQREVRFGVNDAPVCAVAGTTSDIQVDEQDFIVYDAANNTWMVGGGRAQRSAEQSE